jgi:hypothetical protein
MITTILIVLVAVVVLIVIIAVLALHFLRADDSDSFDEGPAEPRNTGRAPADPPRKRTSDNGPTPTRSKTALRSTATARQGQGLAPPTDGTDSPPDRVRSRLPPGRPNQPSQPRLSARKRKVTAGTRSPMWITGPS